MAGAQQQHEAAFCAWLSFVQSCHLKSHHDVVHDAAVLRPHRQLVCRYPQQQLASGTPACQAWHSRAATSVAAASAAGTQRHSALSLGLADTSRPGAPNAPPALVRYGPLSGVCNRRRSSHTPGQLGMRSRVISTFLQNVCTRSLWAGEQLSAAAAATSSTPCRNVAEAQAAGLNAASTCKPVQRSGCPARTGVKTRGQ